MKKPEEIKKGLECCHDAVKCEQCPYQPECDLPFGDIVEADALAYIQQLEVQNAELVQKVNELQRERDAAIRDCARFPCYTCEERENGDFCPQCVAVETVRTMYKWRGLCEENGGHMNGTEPR